MVLNIYSFKKVFIVLYYLESHYCIQAKSNLSFPNSDGFWVQSRKNIIDAQNNPDFTGASDNAGCAFAAYENKENWLNLIFSLAKEYNIDLNKNIISLYFEWSGGNIQKKSALTGLDKRAIIFQYFKVSPIDTQLDAENEIPAYWLETSIKNKIWVDDSNVNIFNIMNFDTWKFEINFEQPLMSQNNFIDLVENTIEPNSPLGKSMGKDGNIGEGIVITFTFKDTIYRFKVKGEKHSKSSKLKL